LEKFQANENSIFFHEYPNIHPDEANFHLVWLSCLKEVYLLKQKLKMTSMKTINKFVQYPLILLCLLLSFTWGCKKDTNSATQSTTPKPKDYDGNVYDTIRIGRQVWMVQNLKTTHYNDGAAIPLITDSLGWINATADAYCWYQNNSNNGSVYGALYNSYVINNTQHQLCPTGWHVPSSAEWDTLITHLGGASAAGTPLKESGTLHWTSPNSGTDASGFTALPGGCRHGSSIIYTPGHFEFINEYGGWWTSSEASSAQSSWWMFNSNASVSMINESLNCGSSVRCIKNAD
jgi:uncharacterized protein (TIGR02145 family)